MLGALVALRRLLRDLSAIAPFLADLGARHAGYGVSAEHYPLVGGALLETMVEVWQPEFTTAWTGAYQTVDLIMIDGVGRSAASRRQGPDLDHLGGLDPPPRFSMSRPAVHEERRVQAARRTRLGREAPRTRGRRVGAEIVSVGRRRRKVDRPHSSGSVLGCAWAMVAPGRPRAWSGSVRLHRKGLDALVNALAAADTGRTLGPGVVVAFRDRVDAGRRLAERMRYLRGEDAVVLGLPRGGVVVAAEVARVLDAPLDVIVVRKLGVPFQPELAMGAVGESGAVVVNERVVRAAHVSEAVFADVEGRERAEVERRARRFREGRPRLAMADRTALVVDDGIATGSTARAACRVARAQGAARVVLAVPVCARDVGHALCAEVDELVCLEMPRSFFAVGQFYTDFRATSDDAVRALLKQAAARVPASRVAAHPAATAVPVDGVVDEEVEVTAGRVRLAGHLTVPVGGRGLVVFVHGSGSSRHSPRNRYVAGVLHHAGLGTLLFDLLTPDEERDRANVFDIELLAGRLAEVTSWVRAHRACRARPIGYFGASTGAAAALWAAARDPRVAAIVSRGGRPDLAAPRLAEVRAATLLIVGGRDAEVLQLNQWAQARMRCQVELAIVPNATHLFEEPGTLEHAADLARDWFVDQLGREAADRPIPVRQPPS